MGEAAQAPTRTGRALNIHARVVRDVSNLELLSPAIRLERDRNDVVH